MLAGVVFWLGMASAVAGWAMVEVIGGRNKKLKLAGFALMVLAIALFYLSADKS